MKSFWRASLAAVPLAFFASPVMAQKLSLGINGGVDFAKLKIKDTETEDTETLDSKTGFSAGATFGVQLHPYFNLGLQGQYVQKGGQETEDGVTIKFKGDYFELLLPLTLTIPIENSPLTPRLYAGPAIGFEVGCKLSAEGGGMSESVDCDAISDITGDTSDNIETESTDYGVFFGGGLDYAVGNGAITLDFLYNLGLGDITKEESEEVKNQVIQIFAGYKFFLGG
jgi:hypothetical protein